MDRSRVRISYSKVIDYDYKPLGIELGQDEVSQAMVQNAMLGIFKNIWN